MKTRCLLIILVLSLSACGFHLRGSSQKKDVEISRVYVSQKAAATVAEAVKEELAGAGAKAVKEISNANYVLQLEREFFDQTVLSVSAETGKVEEYQLSLSLYISLRDKTGKELVSAEKISFSKDYTFDEDAVLGKFAEEDALKQELIELAVDEIIRLLNSEAGKT